MVTNNRDSSGPELIPSDLLDIRGDYLDREQLMTRVADRVNQRRIEIGIDSVRFPSFDGVPYPGTPENSRYDPDLYHHLRLANRDYLEIETELVLEVSPATRIPLVGRIWMLVRSEAHNLVLFYVNRVVRHELNVNKQLISVLNSLTHVVQDQQGTIRHLKAEIDELRSERES